jgi:hypothetical protein
MRGGIVRARRRLVVWFEHFFGEGDETPAWLGEGLDFQTEFGGEGGE